MVHGIGGYNLQRYWGIYGAEERGIPGEDNLERNPTIAREERMAI